MVDCCCSRKFIPAFLPKALVKKWCIRQVFWLNPISGLPACAVACGGNGPAVGGMVYTATGIAPEWNRTSLLMNFVCTILNRNAQ